MSTENKKKLQIDEKVEVNMFLQRYLENAGWSSAAAQGLLPAIHHPGAARLAQ
jgi:hypothetical protein